MKKQIPNIFTCLNLFSGCIAAVLIFRNRMDTASYLVFLAVIFDFLDGMSARLVGAHSAFGKELDSLADVVTFGFVPGTVLFTLLRESNPSLIYANENFLRVFQFFPYIITVFSAWRLAKFNVDERQKESFIGLPTPANTLLIVSLPLILSHDNFHLTGLIRNPYFIVILSIVMSYLLIAEVPLFSLKFKSFSWQANIYQYVLLVSGLILILIFNFVAIPLIILLYVFLSMIRYMNQLKKARTLKNSTL